MKPWRRALEGGRRGGKRRGRSCPSDHVIGGQRAALYDIPAEQVAVVRKASGQVRRVASVCVGAFILAGFDTSSHTIAWCL